LTSTGSEGDGFVRCNVVGVDGDVIVAGGFIGTATFGGASLVSLGGSDVFVARFRGGDGGHVWSRRQGGASQDAAYALSTDGTRIFVGGYFRGTTNLGGTDLVAAGASDGFVAAYDAGDGSPAWSKRFGDTGSDETSAIAASSRQLAVSLGFGDAITIGAQSFTASSGQSTAIAQLDLATGEPSGAWQFGDDRSERLALTYAGRQLAGNGAFTGATNLFGTPLASIGSEDIAVFRVDLDLH
jgi:hypothetical protein